MKGTGLGVSRVYGFQPFTFAHIDITLNPTRYDTYRVFDVSDDSKNMQILLKKIVIEKNDGNGNTIRTTEKSSWLPKYVTYNYEEYQEGNYKPRLQLKVCKLFVFYTLPRTV